MTRLTVGWPTLSRRLSEPSPNNPDKCEPIFFVTWLTGKPGLDGLARGTSIVIVAVYVCVMHFQNISCHCYYYLDSLHWNLGQVVMLLSCLFTFFLNYIVVVNTTVNSALTQAICGNLKVSYVFAYLVQIPLLTCPY